MWRALEIAAADRTNTATAVRDERMPPKPLDNVDRSKDVIPPKSNSSEVGGRTKRCLYRLARISVAERVCGPCSLDDVDDN